VGSGGAAFARYLPELKTEYAFWMEARTALTAGGAHRHAVALEDGSISIAIGTTATPPGWILFRGCDAGRGDSSAA
jgi:hypothetical protein